MYIAADFRQKITEIKHMKLRKEAQESKINKCMTCAICSDECKKLLDPKVSILDGCEHWCSDLEKCWNCTHGHKFDSGFYCAATCPPTEINHLKEDGWCHRYVQRGFENAAGEE